VAVTELCSACSSVLEIIAIGVLGFGVQVVNPQSRGRAGRRVRVPIGPP